MTLQKKCSQFYGMFTNTASLWDFLGGPVTKTQGPRAGGSGSMSGEKTRSHVLQPRSSAAK